MWTVDEEFDQPIRHCDFNRSAGSFCAIFTLRLTPRLDDKAVHFVNDLEGEEIGHWSAFIEEGVRAFLEQRAQDKRPIGYLRVALIEIQVHPIDSKGHRFKQAGVMAMEKAFENHGIWLG